MIDPRIPMLGQSPDMVGAVNSGLADGSNFAKLLIGSQVNRMRDIEDPTQRQAFANKNFFGRQLREQLKADAAAQEKAMYDRLKTEAEISEIGSKAFKNNAQGQGYSLDNSGKTQAAIESVIQQAAMTGDPGQVKIGLGRLAKTGLITPEQYQQEVAIIELMKPEELLKYAQGSALTNKEVAPYLYQTQNNAADNAQSDINNQRTTNASIYSTDVSAQTAANKLEQDQRQFEAKQAYDAYLLKNKPVNTFTDINGYRRHEFADGSSMVVQDENGQPVKAQQTGISAVKQLEHQEKALSFEEAATSAKEAAELARALIGDSAGMSKTTGGWGIMAKIPGTIAKDYSQRVETLKSQVFLTQIEKMKGMGALTDAEGARLEKAIASLDINQGYEQFKANLEEIERVLLRAEQNALKRAGIYRSEQQQQQPQSTFNLFD